MIKTHELQTTFIYQMNSRDLYESTRDITGILMRTGMPAHLKGFNYLRDCIQMLLREPQNISTITRIVYPSIAAKYNTTACAVKHAIRHAILTTLETGDRHTLAALFRRLRIQPDCIITNNEFIATIIEYLHHPDFFALEEDLLHL